MQPYLHRLLDISPLAEGAPAMPKGVPAARLFQVVTGNEHNNVLNGSHGDDTMRGLGGNDVLFGNAGLDAMYGGDGEDNIFGGRGIDTLYGGRGTDRLQGTEDGLVLTTDAPCDFLYGGVGNADWIELDYQFFRNPDTRAPVSVTVDLTTGEGQVYVDNFLGESFGKVERVLFFGGDGNDNITGGRGFDTIVGNGGDDIMRGGKGPDLLSDSWGLLDADGGRGSDTLRLWNTDIGHTYGDIFIDADAGIFMEDGTSLGTVHNVENLTVYADNGTDTIAGFKNGVNVLYGGFGAFGVKTFYGGNLNDDLIGGAADDWLYGGDGDDKLTPSGLGTAYGGDGNDTIFGGAEAASYYGGGGNDLLWVSTGPQKLRGGQGHDTYRIEFAEDSTGPSFDTVVGFDADASDVFDVVVPIAAIDAAVTGGTLSLATFNVDLKAAIGGSELGPQHAVLFAADAGDYAGETFLVWDRNGDAGYQAGKDVVVLLRAAVNLDALDTADFI